MPMRLRKNKPWTPEDGERLKALVASGASPARAAVIFNQTVAGIRQRARALGAPFPSLREKRKQAADPYTWRQY